MQTSMAASVRRALARRSGDAAVAASLAAVAQAELWSSDVRGPLWLVVVAAVAITLPLAWRQRRPLAVLAVSMLAFVVSEVASGSLSELVSPFVALMLAIYSAAANSPPRRAVAGGLVALAAVWLSVALDEGGPDVGGYLYATLVVIAVWSAGAAVARRQVRLSQLEVATERLARERDERGKAAAAQERVRIARELHDVVAHNVGVIVVQAAAERRVLEEEEERTRDVLATIEQVGRETLTELRRLLGVLRTSDDGLELRPQPNLGDLRTMIAQARQAGLPVEIAFEGDEVPVPAGVALSAYRIVQEALTNVLKHAGDARAWVKVKHAGGRLEVEIEDNGGGPGSDSPPGHGLIGMRERAALHGGTLDVGRSRRGGMRIAARLPLEG